MSYEVKSHSQSATVTYQSTLEYVEVEPGLVVYRKTVAPSLADGAEVSPHFQSFLVTRSVEGFATPKAVRAYLAGKPDALGEKANPHARLALASKGLREAFHKLGFNKALESLEDKDGWGCAKQPFAELVEGDASLDDVLYIQHSDHMVFDRKGVVLPVARILDYIEAGMHNKNYNLSKVYGLLKDDPRVEFLDERYRTRDGESPFLRIPHYNQDGGRKEYLCILYMPTQEEACQMWEQQKAYGVKYPSTTWRQAIRDLDLLGLVARGAWIGSDE